MLTALSNLTCNIGQRARPTAWERSPFAKSRLRDSFQLASRIVELSDRLRPCSDAELWTQSLQLKTQAHQGTDLRALLPTAYALVREAARRAHQQSHFDVQLVAGIGLFDGQVVEMQTGEGKTLAALLPAYLHACRGRGCHVITANDYLARRDAEFAKRVFSRLAVSVSCLSEELPREQRQPVYDHDITYGTAREFGFDFLKDQLIIGQSGFQVSNNSFRNPAVVQRGHYFALVDEADSVMIDDARTPLLIAAASDRSQNDRQLIEFSQQISVALKPDQDFLLNPNKRRATLTQCGCAHVIRQSESVTLQNFGSRELFRQIENALAANYLFFSGQHYVRVDNKIAIVDESSGRIADGRQWQQGLHQAIEVKEGLEISCNTDTLARITIQSYFRKYQHVAGLTGTATSAAKEFRRVYRLKVFTVPTRQPVQRTEFPPRIFSRFIDKAMAIAKETKQRIGAGQAVLIGTPSVRASQKISHALREFGIEHSVLNCIEHSHESAIVAEAGRTGQVTVATNMAGRGTDISVDPNVLRAGGLHIIGTELHSSLRIDRQLIGRCARQGQPGSYQFFVSLEDELFSEDREFATELTRPQSPGELPGSWLKRFRQMQSKAERRHERQRLILLDREKKRNRQCRQIGLDPCLEMLDPD